MAKQGGKKSEGKEQPKVFQFSEKEMEELLEQRDEIEAAAHGKPKKASARKKPVAAPKAADPELLKKAAERDKFLDRLQRVQAEYVNYQKRMKRERVDWGDQAVRGFLESLLPLLDDFEGARRTTGKGDPESLVKGIQILRDRLWKILSDHEVTEISSQGETFDPKIHEAVAKELSPDGEEGKILEVLQAGYMFKERVLRATKVKIAMRGQPETPEAPETPAPAEPQAEAPVPTAPPASTEPESSPPPATGNPLLDEPEEQPHG